MPQRGAGEISLGDIKKRTGDHAHLVTVRRHPAEYRNIKKNTNTSRTPSIYG
jgi:hypothetical protein